MKKMIILVLLFIPGLCAAAVPNTFSANTPARASEVNANFTNLDNRLATIEGKQSTCTASGLTIPRTKIITNVGDVVFYNTEKYVIVAMPLINPETGEGYIIKYLAKTDQSVNDKVYTYFSGYQSGSWNPCVDVNVDGYDGVYSYYTRSYMSGRPGPSIDWSTSMTINVSVSFGNMRAAIPIDNVITKKQTKAYANNEYDFAGKMDFSQMTLMKTDVIAKASFMIDYVDIVAVP